MALKDLFSRLKADAEERFNFKPYDPSAGRRALLRGIDQAKEQFGSGRTKVPNRSWTVQNDVVAYSPRLNGTPLVLNGQTTNHVEAADFPAFLDELRALVEAGELDKEIEQIESGGGNAGTSVSVKPARASRGAGLGQRAQPDDKEWMARFEGKHGPAPSPDHVPNAKGSRWVTRADRDRGALAAAKRYGK